MHRLQHSTFMPMYFILIQNQILIRIETEDWGLGSLGCKVWPLLGLDSCLMGCDPTRASPGILPFGLPDILSFKNSLKCNSYVVNGLLFLFVLGNQQTAGPLPINPLTWHLMSLSHSVLTVLCMSLNEFISVSKTLYVHVYPCRVFLCICLVFLYVPMYVYIFVVFVHVLA